MPQAFAAREPGPPNLRPVVGIHDTCKTPRGMAESAHGQHLGEAFEKPPPSCTSNWLAHAGTSAMAPENVPPRPFQHPIVPGHQKSILLPRTFTTRLFFPRLDFFTPLRVQAPPTDPHLLRVAHEDPPKGRNGRDSHREHSSGCISPTLPAKRPHKQPQLLLSGRYASRRDPHDAPAREIRRTAPGGDDPPPPRRASRHSLRRRCVQKITFSANWTSRGSAAAVTFPKSGVSKKRSGLKKFGWLKRLKISVRN